MRAIRWRPDYVFLPWSPLNLNYSLGHQRDRMEKLLESQLCLRYFSKMNQKSVKCLSSEFQKTCLNLSSDLKINVIVNLNMNSTFLITFTEIQIILPLQSTPPYVLQSLLIYACSEKQTPETERILKRIKSLELWSIIWEITFFSVIGGYVVLQSGPDDNSVPSLKCLELPWQQGPAPSLTRE